EGLSPADGVIERVGHAHHSRTGTLRRDPARAEGVVSMAELAKHHGPRVRGGCGPERELGEPLSLREGYPREELRDVGKGRWGHRQRAHSETDEDDGERRVRGRLAAHPDGTPLELRAAA